MTQRSSLKLLLACFAWTFQVSSQVTIVNIAVQPFNITPEGLLNVSILNNDAPCQVELTTQVLSPQNVPLATVRSKAFTVSRGLNAGLSGDRSVSFAEYSASTQGSYLKSTHNLPSGRYRICATLVIHGGSNESDAFCDEVEADFSQYLYLVAPFNGDTVYTNYPILSWAHSEPFTLLGQGEFYRLVVTEMKAGQSAEEAMSINSPQMVKNYVQEHNLQYPFDARELKGSSKYAWQVQKLADGVVINKTEAWEFNTSGTRETPAVKYVVPRRELDGSFYQADKGLVYFKFSEEYKTQGQLKFRLSNAKSQPVELAVTKDGAFEGEHSRLKVTGDNFYELNMNSGKLASGFYTLEIKNEKNESFYLKLFLP